MRTTRIIWCINCMIDIWLFFISLFRTHNHLVCFVLGNFVKIEKWNWNYVLNRTRSSGCEWLNQNFWPNMCKWRLKNALRHTRKWYRTQATRHGNVFRFPLYTSCQAQLFANKAPLIHKRIQNIVLFFSFTSLIIFFLYIRIIWLNNMLFLFFT